MSKIQTQPGLASVFFFFFFFNLELTIFFIGTGKTRSIWVKMGRVPTDRALIAIPIEMTTKKPNFQAN